MPEFLQFLFSGLTVGAIYALIAVGFTLIYSSSDVINFAQGEIRDDRRHGTFFLGAAGVPTAARGAAGHRRPQPLWACCSTASPSIRRKDASAVTLIIITIGASILLRGVAGIGFDKNFHSLPPFIGAEPWNIGGAAVLPQKCAGAARHRHHRAAALAVHEPHADGQSDDRDRGPTGSPRGWSASTPRGWWRWAFAISAAIGAIGGILVTPIALTSYDAGTLLALKGFAAAMLGGIGSPLGAVAGGLPGWTSGSVRRGLRVLRL